MKMFMIFKEYLTLVLETETIEGQDVVVTYKADELISYSVEIGGVATANYTMQNTVTHGAHPHISTDKGDTVVGGSDSSSGAPSSDKNGKLLNTQGVELPSTGGMGTTIFYIIGIILLAGAAIVLVTRRRMNAE
jgi:LPXTG-motif cell wall-anchored protein